MRAVLLALFSCLIVPDRIDGAGDCTHPQLFPSIPRYPAGNGPRSVAIADFDGRGGLDLAVADSVDDGVSILFNNGDGTFAAPILHASGDGARVLTVADFDGVNGPDVATANRLGNDVSVLMNNGDGTFAAPVSYPAGDSPYAIAAGDLDGAGGAAPPSHVTAIQVRPVLL